MSAVDYLILGVIVWIVGGAVFCIYKAKKSGKRCIGCPDSGRCSGSCGNCSCDCGCSHNKT